MKMYVVVGLGRFGQSIAHRLCELGNEVLAIDKNSELVQQISNFVTHAVVADAQDADVLRALGVRNYDCAIVAIGKDLAASVLATLNFKEMGIPLVVCKAHDENHRKVLEKIGADRVVVPGRNLPISWPRGCRPPTCWSILSCRPIMEFRSLQRLPPGMENPCGS